MENIIELTQAEIDLINSKRQKEELEKEKRKCDLLIERQDSVIKMNKEIEMFLKEQIEINDFVQKSFDTLESKFKGVYSLKETTLEKPFVVECYHSKDEILELSITEKYSKFIFAQEDIKYKKLIIVRNDSIKYVINGGVKITWDTYKRKHINIGLYVFGIDYKTQNRLITNVLTGHKNIEEDIRINTKKNTVEELSLFGFGLLEKELKNQFPENDIIFNKNEECKSTQYGNTIERYKVRTIDITFKNGLKVTYGFSYYIDNVTNEPVFKINIGNISLNQLDKTKVIEMLKAI